MRMFAIHRLVGHGRGEAVAEIGIEDDQVKVWPSVDAEGIPLVDYNAFDVALKLCAQMQGVILAKARNVANKWITDRTKAQNFVANAAIESCSCRDNFKCLPCKAREV